jgi:hypothetical protein
VNSHCRPRIRPTRMAAASAVDNRACAAWAATWPVEQSRIEGCLAGRPTSRRHRCTSPKLRRVSRVPSCHQARPGSHVRSLLIRSKLRSQCARMNRHRGPRGEGLFFACKSTNRSGSSSAYSISSKVPPDGISAIAARAMRPGPVLWVFGGRTRPRIRSSSLRVHNDRLRYERYGAADPGPDQSRLAHRYDRAWVQRHIVTNAEHGPR